MYDQSRDRALPLRRSRFGHFFLRGGTACGYNALKIDPVYFGADLFPSVGESLPASGDEILSRVPSVRRAAAEATLKQLCDAHVLVPTHYDENGYLEEVRRSVPWRPRIRVMVLHLTDYCNLRCRYCFIEGSLPEAYRREQMSPGVARAALELFGRVVSHAKPPKPPSVVFYGGEPLANPGTLRTALEDMRDLQHSGAFPHAADKVVITNGTLIDRPTARLLREHEVMVSVSVDGPRDVHDANRVGPDGTGSFERVHRGIAILREEGIAPTVSCVVAKENVRSATRIARFLLEDLGVEAIGLNHVSIIPSLNDYDPAYEQQFGTALIEVQELIQREFPAVYERRLNHKLNHFLKRNILRADCTGCGEQMAVTTGGAVGVCQGYMGSRKTFGGSVFDDTWSPEADPVFVEWSRRSPLNMEECGDCPALATCGGGCPRNADVLHGTIWAPDSAFCHFAREAQEWMIWKQHEAQQERSKLTPA